MAIRSLNEKFMHGLADMYDAEHQFLQAMQEQLRQATDPTVQQLLTTHIGQTQQHIQNLEQVFSLLGQQARRQPCDAAKGLVTEGTKLMKECQDNPALLNLAIGTADAKVEHYEIASYRDLIAGAQFMNQPQMLQLLQQNLQQEEQTAQLIEQNTPALLQKAAGTQPYQSGQSLSSSPTL
jgi:ferritin-like metal-binding protein YciE